MSCASTVNHLRRTIDHDVALDRVPVVSGLAIILSRLLLTPSLPASSCELARPHAGHSPRHYILGPHRFLAGHLALTHLVCIPAPFFDAAIACLLDTTAGWSSARLAARWRTDHLTIMGNNHSTPADDGQEAPRRRQRPPRRPSHASGSSVGQISTAGSAQPGAPASSQPPATSSRTDRTTRWASGLETPTMYRRETRAERDARRRARDEAARLQERERSMREESVDGGFLVTLGTYQGVEDFAKPVVRRLQVSHSHRALGRLLTMA